MFFFVFLFVVYVQLYSQHDMQSCLASCYTAHLQDIFTAFSLFPVSYNLRSFQLGAGVVTYCNSFSCV